MVPCPPKTINEVREEGRDKYCTENV